MEILLTLLGCSPLSHIQHGVSRESVRLLAITRYIGKIWDGQTKVKSSIVLDLSDI